jgi:hypothetical protein
VCPSETSDAKLTILNPFSPVENVSGFDFNPQTLIMAEAGQSLHTTAALNVKSKQAVEKLGFQAVQKGPDARRAWSVIVSVQRDRKIPTSTNTSHEHEFVR